ncbi:MAG: 18S rRNA maturation protein [Phylliscum demangeonii]|nr:MAG: 18S rRNA maturation protein [Phylliscum demangeonii]
MPPPKRPASLHQSTPQPQQHRHRRRTKGPSVTKLHKKVRDASRLLRRPAPLAADVAMEVERARAAYAQELEAAKAERRKQKMIGRYHKIRFFERQKATRRLKRVQRLKDALLASAEADGNAPDPDALRALDAQLHEIAVDLNYTMYCPLGRKYVALYAGGEEPGPARDDDEAAPPSTVKMPMPKPKPPFWGEVERRMEHGGLEELRNEDTLAPSSLSLSTAEAKVVAHPSPPVPMRGEALGKKTKSGGGGRGSSARGTLQQPQPEPQAARKPHHAAGAAADDDDAGHKEKDEESDGGFFE